MTALTARNVALTDQVLAALSDEAGLPISTMALLAKLNAAYPEPALADLPGAARSGSLDGTGARPLRVYHGDLLRVLNRLAKRGDVEKVRLPGMRCLYWRRWLTEDSRDVETVTLPPERGVLASVPPGQWRHISGECNQGDHGGCTFCGCTCHPGTASKERNQP